MQSKDVSLTSAKSEITVKMEEIWALQSRVEELEQDVSRSREKRFKRYTSQKKRMN